MDVATLTAADRCDRCGAQAYARATMRATTSDDAGRKQDPWRCLSGHHHPVPSLARECDARLEAATKPRVAA